MNALTSSHSHRVIYTYIPNLTINNFFMYKHIHSNFLLSTIEYFFFVNRYYYTINNNTTDVFQHSREPTSVLCNLVEEILKSRKAYVVVKSLERL